MNQRLEIVNSSTTQIDAEQAATATSVWIVNCPALTTVPDFPAATSVRIENCPALTAVPDFPAATSVSIVNCPALIEEWAGRRLEPLLTATDKSVAGLLASSWDCHDWDNCPMHYVFGANDLSEVPRDWRKDATIFVTAFDAGAIRRELVEAIAANQTLNETAK